MNALDDYSRLAKAVGIPIAGGENEHNIARFKDDLDREVYDIVQPDAIITGITGARKIGILAEARHRLCILHTWNAGGLGLAANLQVIGSLSNCPFLEFPYDPPAWTIEVRDRFLRNPIVPDGGVVRVPEKPGLGVEVDMDRLRSCAISW
jgi:L-alanine-DL-glutamate epimerase-like enolase superfamily enzyme